MKRTNDRPRVRVKKMTCNHEYQWIETVRGSREAEAVGQVEYELIDRFYCKYCLDIQEASKKAIIDKYQDMPGWF